MRYCVGMMDGGCDGPDGGVIITMKYGDMDER